MTTIFDTATQKQIEKFNQFKQELLNWKNSHAQDYTAFVRHMNSDKPEAMTGLGQMLAILCPQISFAVADCWNDDTLSSRDWLQRISEEVSISSIIDVWNNPYQSISDESMQVDTTPDDVKNEVKDFIEQNGSISDFAHGIMKDILGDIPVPDEMNDFLNGVFGSLQTNVDKLTSNESVDQSIISDTMNNLQGVFNDCLQNEYVGSPMQEIVKWISDVKLQDPENFIPLLLTWLIHGRAFEKIVTTLNEQAELVSWPTNKTILDAAVNAIESSIENGYRTPQQWTDYIELFPDLNSYIVNKCKEQGLIMNTSVAILQNNPKGKPGREKGMEGTLSQYLTCQNPSLVLNILEEYIKAHPTANDIALTGIVLRSLNMIPDLTEDRETSSAIYKEFSTRIPDLRAESSIRRSMGALNRSIVKTEKDGSKREIFEYDMDTYGERKQILISEIQKALES